MPFAATAKLILPLDAMSESGVAALTASTVFVRVPRDYEALLGSASGASEVLGIQRLLTIGRRPANVRVEWNRGIAAKVLASPSIFPMLSVLLLLEGATHWIAREDGVEELLSVEGARKNIFKHRLARDMFADSEIVLCADSRGEALPPDLYNPRTGTLREREDFETLVVDAIGAQRGDSAGLAGPFSYANALGVIVAELFENTDVHARFDLDGRPLARNCIRGLLFKRVKVAIPRRKDKPKDPEPTPKLVDCFEISVFDSGVGYFASYTRNEPTRGTVDLVAEWRVLHNCLERHYHPELADGRPGHRAMGLYEVLRAIQALKGRIEFRTGRLYAYRTFLDGELQTQMQPKTEFAHLAWPKPRLVDVDKKYFAIPSEHEGLVGTSVRVIVPLG